MSSPTATTDRAVHGRPRRLRARATAGFTIVEVLVATLVLTIGIVAMFSNFTSSQKLGTSAEVHQAAAAVAEGELERLRGLKWSELALTEARIPTRVTESSSPSYWEVSPSTTACAGQGPSGQTTHCFQWEITETSAKEPMVIEAGAEATYANPHVVTTTATLGGGATRLSFEISRFITWVSDKEGCTATTCEGTGDDKRIVLGVTGTHLDKPLYFTTIVTNRELGESDPLKGQKCTEGAAETECVDQT